MTLRQRYGELIESEEEFRKFYALQKAFDEKFSPEEMMFSAKPADVYRLRAEAEHKLLADMGEVVGESRAKAVRYAVDQDYIMISTLCRRLNLPSKAAEEVMRIRENYATQSLVVNNESGVNFNDRRALIQELHKEAQKELAGVLGKEGMDAYGPRSTWLRYLESGMAYSTDAKDSRSTGSIGSPSMGVYYVSSMTSVRPPSPSAAPSSGTGSTAPASATTPAGAKRSKTPPVSGRSDEKSAPVSPPATEPAASPAK